MLVYCLIECVVGLKKELVGLDELIDLEVISVLLCEREQLNVELAVAVA